MSVANNIKVDYINIGLILVSLVAAFIIPFHLFLFAYAILGPLHYLTEINWLHDRKYFVGGTKWLWIPIVFALLILLPKLIYAITGSIFIDVPIVKEILVFIDTYNNGFIFLWFAISAGLIFTRNKKQMAIVALTSVVIAILFNSIPSYTLIVGLLIPTVIHVYLFTLLFMLYGALRSESKPGMTAVVLHAVAPVAIALIFINPESYSVAQSVRQTFIAGGFPDVNTSFASIFGLADGKEFSFDSLIDIRIQIFMAFAYTYHYLNWFSKTTIIGWHKALSSKRSLIIAFAWIVSISIYFYDYAIGLLALLTLSMLHVFLEFPLNFLSMQGIAMDLFTFG